MIEKLSRISLRNIFFLWIPNNSNNNISACRLQIKPFDALWASFTVHKNSKYEKLHFSSLEPRITGSVCYCVGSMYRTNWPLSHWTTLLTNMHAARHSILQKTLSKRGSFVNYVTQKTAFLAPSIPFITKFS